MADILSQNEIDELLKALSSGEIDVNEIQEQAHEKKITTYDFRRPNKFAKDQLRTLQIIYENFSRLMASYLSGVLRTYCQVDLVSVEPQTYYEFINSLPDPVILGIIDFKPLKGSIIMEFSPGIVFSIIDKILGGTGKFTDSTRDFTEIEIALIERIIKQLLLLMSESWTNVMDTSFKLARIETNAQFAQIISPNETIAIITVNVNIANREGMMNICIPHMVIEPIINQLSTKYWFSTKMTEEGNKDESSILTKKIEETYLELRAILGNAQITIREFLGLQQGDVIMLDRKVEEDISLVVGDGEKFSAIVGVKDKKLAVQITRKEWGEVEDDE